MTITTDWPSRMAGQTPAAKLIRREIHICGSDGQRNVRIFWISLQIDGGVSIGATDKSFEVSRITHDGSCIPTAVVRNPHVTYHPPNWCHLTGNRGKPICEFLTWGSEGPLGNPPELWIEFITSPLRDLPARSTRRGGHIDIEIWKVNLPDNSKSIMLLVDFLNNTLHDVARSNIEKRLTWGKTALRFRLALVDAQAPRLQLHTWG